MRSVVVYVDGHNLYHGLHSKFEHTYLWLDLTGDGLSIRQFGRGALRLLPMEA